MGTIMLLLSFPPRRYRQTAARFAEEAAEEERAAIPVRPHAAAAVRPKRRTDLRDCSLTRFTVEAPFLERVMDYYIRIGADWGGKSALLVPRAGLYRLSAC